MMAVIDATLTMRPQRDRIIGISSGCVTLKNPFRTTSMTRVHCSRRMPAIGASSVIPALLTRICTAPASSSVASARVVASASVTSKAMASADPPDATIAAATRRASSMRWCACTQT
jgi:hypothetical protein